MLFRSAIGKSRAGNTSKIHLGVDAYGLPITFDLTGGHVNDCSQAASLIAKVQGAKTIIADKGYDSEAIRAQVKQQGSQVVIPRKRNSLKGNADLDRGLYRHLHLVENAFARLKHFRAVASRFDKLKRNYESVIAMACAFSGYQCETATAPSTDALYKAHSSRWATAGIR